MSEPNDLVFLSKITKVKRYGWNIIDSPGRLEYVDKQRLVVDHTYQRNYNPKKSIELAKRFSHFHCGVLTCADRSDGTDNLYIVDGQHRFNAVQKRSDIQKIPVIIFNTTSTREEANAFVGTNTFRKNVKSIEKFKAQIVGHDPIAVWLKEQLDTRGIRVSDHAINPLQIKSITSCMVMIKESKEDFIQMLDFISELCVDDPIREKVMLGVYYIIRNLGTPITDKRLRKRLLMIGPKRLEKAATQAAAYYSKGGSRIYAQGMIEHCNKGMKNRFKFKENITIPENASPIIKTKNTPPTEWENQEFEVKRL